MNTPPAECPMMIGGRSSFPIMFSHVDDLRHLELFDRFGVCPERLDLDFEPRIRGCEDRVALGLVVRLPVLPAPGRHPEAVDQDDRVRLGPARISATVPPRRSLRPYIRRRGTVHSLSRVHGAATSRIADVDAIVAILADDVRLPDVTSERRLPHRREPDYAVRVAEGRTMPHVPRSYSAADVADDTACPEERVHWLASLRLIAPDQEGRFSFGAVLVVKMVSALLDAGVGGVDQRAANEGFLGSSARTSTFPTSPDHDLGERSRSSKRPQARGRTASDDLRGARPPRPDPGHRSTKTKRRC